MTLFRCIRRVHFIMTDLDRGGLRPMRVCRPKQGNLQICKIEPVAYDSVSMNRCRLLVIGTMAWLLTGCQAMPGFISSAPQPVSSPTTFKVLTYNTLHGLEVSKL